MKNINDCTECPHNVVNQEVNYSESCTKERRYITLNDVMCGPFPLWCPLERVENTDFIQSRIA